LQKGWILCQEATVQGQPVRVPARAGVWAENRARVEAGWADHLRQGRAEIVCAQAVEQRSFMLPDSRAMQKAVLNVEQK